MGLTAGIEELRSKNAANKREMAKDLTEATENFSTKLAAQKKAQDEAHATLTSNIGAATAKSAAELKTAQAMFDSKIVMLTNTVVANHKAAEEGISKLTGVVADTAKAVEQRIAEHLKNTKRYLQVELIEQAEKAADNVFNILQGKRQFIADNYLSLKAYSIASADKIQDYREAGKGLALSSIGDLLVTVGALGAVKAPAAEGLGMGGDKIPAIFSGKSIKVSGAVAEINGLVNEFTTSSKQVRERWPMGLGKYLLDKLEVSMSGKGVLQVDKVDGKNGNYVYINGRSVGLSDKLSDFSSLASKMSVYEAVLAKLTAKVKSPPQVHKHQISVGPPQWEGN